MPRPEDDDDDGGNHDPIDPAALSPPADEPPVLDYPSPITEGDFGETESWPEVGRAMLIVFSTLGVIFVITFGLCGVLVRGCG